MTRVSVSEAAKLTGKSRETINKATQTGKLSFTRGENDRKEIEVAELQRVYRLRKTVDQLSAEEPDVKKRPAVSDPDKSAENAALAERLAGTERALETLTAERDRERRQLEAEIETLRGSLEKMQDQHGKALLLITDQSTRGRNEPDAWKRAIEKLEDRVANQEREVERSKNYATRLENQLKADRERNWFDRLLNR